MLTTTGVRTVRRWATGAVVGVVTTLLAGCSGAQQASTSLPPTSAPAATAASPTLAALGPADLPMPPEARQQTAEAFNAFSRYYIALINRLDTNLDSSYLRRFSRGCPTCERITTDADSDARKGYRYQGGTITISAQAAAHLTADGAETAFTTEQAAYTVVDSAGAPVAGLSGPALSGVPSGAQGVWSGDHWVVTNLSFG